METARAAPGTSHTRGVDVRDGDNAVNKSVSRREALRSAGAGLATVGFAVPLLAGQTQSTSPAAPASLWPDFPRQDPALAKELVGVCHRDIARAAALVEAEPALVNAAWDWGFGDWETPLGAASHTGRREIAEMLLAKGARPDIFSMAMLGRLDAVRAAVESMPGIQRCLGPHGITLAAHARAGGDEAKATLDYLLSLGDADIPPASVAIDAEQLPKYAGVFAFGPGSDERLEVLVKRQHLEIGRAGRSSQRTYFTGNDTFFPSGVPTTSLAFKVEGDRAVSLTIRTGGRVIECARAQ